MFISSDIFLKGMPHWDLGNPKDIHSGNLCYPMTTNQTGECNHCILNATPDSEAPDCQTEFASNPDLKASIDAFRESHPEYFI